MSFAYRYDNDDLGNYDRYKYSYVAQWYDIDDLGNYVAQFGTNTNTHTDTCACAARIVLPRKTGGNLRDCDSVTYFVYAEYRVLVDKRTILIDKLEAINFDDKLHMTSATDHVIVFFMDEVLRDRHEFDCYVPPVGQPVNINSSGFEIKLVKVVKDRTIDYTETDMKKLTLAWFATDFESDLYFL